MSNKPTLLALVGKSGAGKNYIEEYLTEIQTIIPTNKITQWTTRPKRENEKEDEDYHFISEKDFEFMIECNLFAEWQKFNGWYYGTILRRNLSNDNLNICILNASSIRQIIDNFNYKDLNLIIWEIRSNDYNRIMRSLKREDNVDAAEVLRRFQADDEDFEKFYKYINLLRAESFQGKNTCLVQTRTYVNNNDNEWEIFKKINKNLLTIKEEYDIM